MIYKYAILNDDDKDVIIKETYMASKFRDVDVNSATAIGSAVILGTIGVLSFIVQPGLVQGFSSQYEVGEDVANFLASAEGFGIALATIITAFASRAVN